jgi:prepilin-type N-terminal cleavage/methylation domain-containing protein
MPLPTQQVPHVARRSPTPRRGMTLIEVILAIVILSGAMLGLARFGQQFQRNTSSSSTQVIASDLATQRLETIKGVRNYASLVTTYGATAETFVGDPVYGGFTRYTKAVATSTSTDDYVTVTVSIAGNNLTTAIKKSTKIAKF